MPAVNEFSFVRELYIISSPNTDTVYWCTGDTAYNDGFHLFIPAPVSRSNFSLSTDLSIPKVSISVPPVESLLRYLANYPVTPTTVTIKRVTGTTTIVLFSGKIKTVMLQNSVAIAECSSGSDILDVNIPNKVCGAFCQNSLFDSDCGLAPSDYVLSTEVVPYSQYLQSVNFESFDNGYFSGGYVQTVTQDFRFIIFHEGDKIYLQAPFPSNLVTFGTLVYVYPGCDGVYSTCDTKFDNLNPGGGKGFCGMPTIPSKNPVIWGFKGPSTPEGGTTVVDPGPVQTEPEYWG